MKCLVWRHSRAPGHSCCLPPPNPELRSLRLERVELWEETGLSECELGPCAWLRQHTFYWNPERLWYNQQERYFVSRIASHTVVTDNQEALEAQFMTEHRWWALAEMRTTNETLVPGNFAELFESLLANGPPAEPFEAGL